jgi:hypothetical protein
MGHVAAKTADWRTVWFDQGRLVERSLTADGGTSADDIAIRRHGLVRVTIDFEAGTTVSWAVFAPNWSSLYYIMEELYLYPGPYHLQFYLAGWFSETVAESRAARDRIHSLIARSDVHLLTGTYVKHVDPDPNAMPLLLQDAWGDRAVKPDYSIDCIRDEDSDRFTVMRIGPRSTIAQKWGVMPASYPCLSGNVYDRVVSEIYPQVIKTGEPHYSHVYAAMVFPNRQLCWFPYHRVVLPHRFPDGRDGVTVVSEFSPVDIQIV